MKQPAWWKVRAAFFVVQLITLPSPLFQRWMGPLGSMVAACFFCFKLAKAGRFANCSMTWYSKLWICMAICQQLQRGAKWFLKGVNSPSLRALGFNAKLKRYIPVFGSWFHVFFTTTYGDVSIWLITRFLKWWNLSLLSRCDASVRGSFLEMDVSVVSGGGFRLGGLRCFLQVQECNVHFFYFFLWGGGYVLTFWGAFELMAIIMLSMMRIITMGFVEMMAVITRFAWYDSTVPFF